ncbi:Fc.00g102460.m01.CDS01 [Cosmosporella sp. VM-42]
MSLLRLSPELLLHILSYLGAEFFRQDVRRLTISKRWYVTAWPMILQDLRLSVSSFRPFVIFSKQKGMRDAIQRHVAAVEIGLTGFDGWQSAEVDAGETESTPRTSYFDMVNQWTSRMNDSLADVAVILQRCDKLRTLRLEARLEYHDPSVNMLDRAYVMVQPLAWLVDGRHLTSLELDTAGTSLLQPEDTPSGIHLCNAVSSLLPTLRRLRCRMRTICGGALAVPEGDTPLNLEEVIINLSLSGLLSRATSYRYTTRCRVCHGDSFSQFRKDMENQATKLSLLMKTPRLVRVLSHEFPSLEVYTFDALTQRRMKLAADSAWDSDGEVVVENDSSEEEDLSDISDDSFGSSI